MVNAEKATEVSAVKSKKTPRSQDDKLRDNVVRESRDQYRNFLDSINRSSDREIDRAMSRM